MQQTITKKESAELPTKYGNFTITVFEDDDQEDHAALVKESKDEIPFVRLHSECLTGDAFHSLKCDCQPQLEKALEKFGKDGGILIYLRQEGRGIGLLNKIKAYNLQDRGFDTVQANEELGFKPDMRDYSIAAQILKDLNVTKIKLLTNNPEKVKKLESLGITIVERIPHVIEPTEKNKQYLKVKKDKLGHLF